MLFLPIVQGDLTCIEALANKFVALQASQNVVYTEVRYSPHMLTAAAAFGALEAGGVGAALDDDAARAVVDTRISRPSLSPARRLPGLNSDGAFRAICVRMAYKSAVRVLAPPGRCRA